MKRPARPLPRPLLWLALLPLLAGCAALTAVSDATEVLEVYELRAPAAIEATRRAPVPRDVIIEVPTTSGALSTDRIMIRPNRLQAQYLPGVRWSEPVPVMVQTLMLRSAEATGALRYVGREPLGLSGDFAVVTEVTDFQAETFGIGEGALVRINLIVRIVREADARIVASRTLKAEAQAVSTETDPLAEAFNRASDQVFADFALWLRGTVTGR